MTCLCACPEPLLPPNCRFATTEKVLVDVWFNVSREAFVSTTALSLLRTGLGVTPAKEMDVSFEFAESNVRYNKTNARFLLIGLLASKLLIDAARHAPWIRNAHIESAYHFFKLPGPQPHYKNEYIIYKSDDGRIEVTADHVAWLLAAMALTALLILFELCCLANDDALIVEALQEEAAEATRQTHRADFSPTTGASPSSATVAVAPPATQPTTWRAPQPSQRKRAWANDDTDADSDDGSI